MYVNKMITVYILKIIIFLKSTDNSFRIVNIMLLTTYDNVMCLKKILPNFNEAASFEYALFRAALHLHCDTIILPG